MIYWILTTPRSGSNFFAAEIWRRIGGKPRPMEFFNPEAIALHTDFTPRPDAPVGSYLEYLQERESFDGTLCVKMLWTQVDACLRYPEFLPELAKGKIIYLQRRDVIMQGISHYIALKTGEWISGHSDAEASAGRAAAGGSRSDVTYSFDEITVSVARMELFSALIRRFLLSHSLPCLEVSYEDFVSDTEAQSRRVLDYLGLKAVTGGHVPDQPFRRQTTELNLDFHSRYVADERARFASGHPKGLLLLTPGITGSHTGDPLFRMGKASSVAGQVHGRG